MANEATCIEKSVVNDVMRSVSDCASIEKGTLLWLYGTNQVSGASLGAAGAAPFAGIATAEKVANDGSTKISVAVGGVWDIKCVAGGFPDTIGELVVLSGQNLIAKPTNVTNAISGGAIVGKCEEVGSTGDTIRVRLIGY